MPNDFEIQKLQVKRKYGGGEDKKGISIKHIDLAAKSLVWLANRSTLSGIRGSQEIRVAPGYVADAVALCSLQYRYYERYAKIAGFTKKWEKNTHFLSSFKSIDETKMDYNLACLFEVKITRTDFESTFKNPNGKHSNRYSPIVNLHWVVTPPRLIKPDELPEFWGLLEGKGVGLTEVKEPIYNKIPVESHYRLGYTILWNSGHRKNYHGYIKQCPNCLKEIEENKEE